jgi:O-antigen ligase
VSAAGGARAAAGRAIGDALLWLVALAPLALGANRPWAWNLAATLTALLLLASLLPGQGPRPAFAVAPGRLRLPLLLFTLVCGYILVQLAPLPPDMAGAEWRRAARLLDVEVLRSASIAPDSGIVALTRLLLNAGVFWLALQTSRRAAAADRAMLGLALVVGAYALAGVIGYAAGNQRLLWFAKWFHEDSLTGTFVNRNHFATFVGLGFIGALSVCARRAAAALSGPGRDSWVELLSGIRLSTMALVACLPIEMVALLLSRSRAGVAATAVAGSAFLAGAIWRLGLGRLAAAALVALAVAMVGIYATLSGAGLRERLANLAGDEHVDARFPLFARTLDAIADRPWLGHGYGSFEDAFRPHRAPPIDLHFDRAHNTYLELAVELGVPMAALLTLVPLLLVLRAARALRREGPTLYYGWAAACAGLLVGLHALVDFSLQIPAVAMLFATMLGVGCAQSWNLREDTSLPPARG